MFILLSYIIPALVFESLLFLVRVTKKGEGEYFEFVWRFSKWAKRPVYQVEYFGLPWEYKDDKAGEFRTSPYSQFGYKMTERKENMAWQVAPYPPVQVGFRNKDCGPIEAHSRAKATWEFKHSPLFKQNPYLEFRVVEKEAGLLKSARKRQQHDQQRELLANYRSAYITHLEDELNKYRELN